MFDVDAPHTTDEKAGCPIDVCGATHRKKFAQVISQFDYGRATIPILMAEQCDGNDLSSLANLKKMAS